MPAESDFLSDTVFRCQNEVIVLSPDNLNYQDWNFLWSTNDETSELEVEKEGLYSLEVYKGECSYTDQVWIKSYEELWVPNVMTPNGDGLNDLFIIKNLTSPVHLAIYNKWGKLIFENEEYFNSWSAEGLEPGTYYCTIREKAGCHQNNFIKGWVDIRH